MPLTMRYAEALLKPAGPKTAHAVLLDLFNNVAPTPEQIRFTALAASSAGDTADAAYYMSEYHIATGNLPLSVTQLEMALAVPDITAVQRSRFQARLDEVREALPKERARLEQPDEGAGGRSAERREPLGRILRDRYPAAVRRSSMRQACTPVAVRPALIVLRACCWRGAPRPESARESDPIEPFNRGVYKFNDALDRGVLKPTAKAYDKVDRPNWFQHRHR